MCAGPWAQAAALLPGRWLCSCGWRLPVTLQKHFQQHRDTQNTNILYSFCWLLTLQYFLKCFKFMMTVFFFLTASL